MVINSLQGSSISEQQKSRLKEILAMGTENEEIIREAIAILTESGSIEYASSIAKEMIRAAWQDLENDLPEDTDLAKKAKSQLNELSEYLVDREL